MQRLRAAAGAVGPFPSPLYALVDGLLGSRPEDDVAVLAMRNVPVPERLSRRLPADRRVLVTRAGRAAPLAAHERRPHRGDLRHRRACHPARKGSSLTSRCVRVATTSRITNQGLNVLPKTLVPGQVARQAHSPTPYIPVAAMHAGRCGDRAEPDDLTLGVRSRAGNPGRSPP